jgi:uncharacterized protein (DUF4415 family)
MTVEQMRAARKRGESQSDWEAVRQRIEAGVEPEEDEDSPEGTEVIREAIAKRRAGQPVGASTKEQVSLRIDRDVLTAFRATGPGWQARLNAALRDWLETHSPAP